MQKEIEGKIKEGKMKNKLEAGERSFLCFRIDDVHPRMDWERFIKFMNLMDEYGIHPLLGVIPECKDSFICQNKEKTDFWETIREYQNKRYPIAMHGYDHVYITEDAGIFTINSRSEFAGIDVKTQEKKIAEGKAKFEKERIKSNIFMAPAHSFDNTTIDILKRYHFEYITDGFSKEPYQRNGMTFIPVTLNIREIERKTLRNGITTLVIHTNTMNDTLLGRYKDVCETHKDSLVSYEEIMKLRPSEYDAGYEKRKIAEYRRVAKLYGLAKKVLRRKKSQ